MLPDSVHTDMPTFGLAQPRRPDDAHHQKRLPDNIPASRLFQGSHEILIDHNSETYRLRITKNGKLILTK